MGQNQSRVDQPSSEMASPNINKQVFIYLKTSQESSPYDIAKKNKSWQDLLTIYNIQDWKEQTANDWIWALQSLLAISFTKIYDGQD